MQEIVKDSGLAERFRGWAMRWGDDDPDACHLHREVYNMLERHIMGITASQFVWQEHGENEVEQLRVGNMAQVQGKETMMHWWKGKKQMQGETYHLCSSWMMIPRLPIHGNAHIHNLRRGDMMRRTE